MMKKLVSISLTLAMSSIAFAQQGAPAPKAPAQPLPKAGAPAQPVPAKQPAPPKAAPEKTMPAKPPAPPQELTDLAKQMAGTWNCTGKVDMGGQMVDVKARITHKLDPNLDKFWLQSTFTGKAPKMPPFKFTMYRTYDPAAKKLWRVGVNSMGGHGTATGTLVDKKVTWEGEYTGPMGSHKFRDSEEMVSAKEVKVVGEISKDGGKTWTMDHDATCKK